ncbi:18125_t:CDS:1, partial [Acaulospora morrowiae]
HAVIEWLYRPGGLFMKQAGFQNPLMAGKLLTNHFTGMIDIE